MEKYPKRVIVRLTAQQDRQLQQLAYNEGRTVSQMLRRLIEDNHDRNISKEKKTL